MKKPDLKKYNNEELIKIRSECMQELIARKAMIEKEIEKENSVK